MAEDSVNRKLRAILSADVKGYSRLMGEDEVGTYQTLTSYLESIRSIISEHNGRVFSSPGDAVMAVFASVIDAVQCAVKIQEKIETVNADVPEDQKMQFRIGVNLGDVIHDGEQIYGDGVNIAARIETLAEPGGVSISRTVYNHVSNKLKFGYEYQGEHQVKNITKPIRVYKVLTAPDHAGQLIGEPQAPTRSSKTPYIALVAVLVVAAAAAIWYFQTRAPEIEPASVEKMAYPLPDKPSIAVLPFDNMSGDPKQDYFSDGITEDLITDLSKISGIFVIARNSTFTYKGKPVKVQQVAEDLGVRYVLEGSVRRQGEKVRINAQLVDATTGHHLWAERFDGKLADIFALQDKVTRIIVTALSVKLTHGEQQLFDHRDTDNVKAYDAFLQGLSYFNQTTKEGLKKAVTYFKKALELDPNYTRAHGMLAKCYQYGIATNWYKDLGWPNARSLRDQHLQEAMKNPTPYAYQVLAYILVYRDKHNEAVAEAKQALHLAPNDAQSHLAMGRALVWSGKSDEAIEYLQNAMRLNPYYPPGYLWYLGMARFLTGQWQESLALAERASMRGVPQAMWLEALAHAQLDHGQKAADILAKYFETRGWTMLPIENAFKAWPFKEQKDRDLWVDSVKKAGLPRPWNPVFRREYDKAIADAERAIALNPDDPKAQFAMGESLVFIGRPAEAVVYLKKAISLDPDYSSVFLYTLGLAQFCLEDYEEAAVSLEAYNVKRKKEHLIGAPWWLLAATYAHLGKQQKAEEVLAKYMKKRGYKGYTVKRVLKYNYYAFKNPQDIERIARGLHKAGLPME